MGIARRMFPTVFGWRKLWEAFMSAATDFLEDKILNHVFRNVAYTAPATVYVGLFTTATTDAGGGTEVTGGGYARQAGGGHGDGVAPPQEGVR